MGKKKRNRFISDEHKQRMWITAFFISFVVFLVPVLVVLVHARPENTPLNVVLGVMYLFAWENVFRRLGVQERWYRLSKISLGDALEIDDCYKIEKKDIGKKKIFRRVDAEAMVIASEYRGRWSAIAVVAICLLIYIVAAIRNGGGFAKDYDYIGAVADMLIITGSLYIMLYDLLYPTMYITLDRKMQTITIPAPMPFCLFAKPKTIPFKNAVVTFMMGNDNKYKFNGSLAIFHPSFKLNPVPTEFSGFKEGGSIIALMQKYMNPRALPDLPIFDEYRLDVK